MSSARVAWDIARLELRINTRNRWTIMFAVVFALLIAGISYVGIKAEGYSGMQNFTRTSASMLNLVLYVVPLVALIMGTLSATGDRGATELLYAQPVSRHAVLLGKAAGNFLSLALAMLSGFLAAGGIITSVAGTAGLSRYIVFVGLSLVLGLIFLVLAILIATLHQRANRSFGVALFAWFFFVLFYDLIVIGVSVLLKGAAANRLLFLSLFGNPVGMVRVASLIFLDDATIFGASGAALLRYLGGAGSSVALLLVALLLWVILPFLLASRILRTQDV